MTLFESILKECNLLMEATNVVTDKKINDAIKNFKIVSIVYDDERGVTPKTHRLGKSWRYIYPTIYGVTKKGKKAIWAYQDGGSTSEGVPRPGTHKHMRQGWKLFLLDNINAWYNQENTEEDKSHTFISREIAEFNKKGDGSRGPIFSTVISISPEITDYPVANNSKNDIADSEVKNNIINMINGKQTPPEEITQDNTVNQYKEKENGITLDNNGKLDYNSNIGKQNNATTPENSQDSGDKIMAPATEPVAKSDIEDVQVQQTNAEEPEQEVTADDKPITKDNVNGEDEENKPENDVTSIYESYMNRWENLYR